ncbi:MAG TPA: ATP-binding protein [Chloroflexota bacterium]|nr:ATP-binding protein [Chloroflexota bacterium]
MRDFFSDLAFAGSCLAMGVILALLLSKLIAKRIQYITLSTARIGAGDLSQRLNVTVHDEIAKLAAQFNVMVEQLQQAMDSEKAVAERYQRLLENIADGYVILQNGEIVYSNRQMGTMLGYDVASLVGIKVASLVSPEFAKKAENHLNSRLRGEELPSNSEWELRTADGRYLPIEINSHTIEYLGRPALASTVRDVTQRRQMEAQRARLIREEAEGKALRDLLHQKNRLVSTISHELRTPLCLVMGFSEILYTRNLNQEQMHSVCREIHSGSLRLKRIVDEIVQFAEVQGTSAPIEPTIVDLVELTRDCVEEMAAEEPRHIFKVQIPEQLERVRAAIPPGRFRDALGHLLSNAARFSPSGSEVQVSLGVNKENATVTVVDQGVGIAPEELGRVFEPFFRTERSHRRAVPGTGLGLAITKRLIELWGGQITAHSNTGHGSRFSFTVPLVDSHPSVETASGNTADCG